MTPTRSFAIPWIVVADLFLGTTLFLLERQTVPPAAVLEAHAEIRFSRELIDAMNVATQVTRSVQERLARELNPVAGEPQFVETEIAIPNAVLFKRSSFDDFMGDATARRYLRLIGGSLRDALDAAGGQRRFFKIVIEGHADRDPISAHAATAAIPSNWELSSRRATGVLRFLVGEGYLPTGVTVLAVGRADTQPVALGADENSKASNRRIVIRIEPDLAAIRTFLDSGPHH